MNSRRFFLLFSGLALISYGVVFTANFLDQKSVWLSENFTDALRLLLLASALLLLVGAIWGESKKSLTVEQRPAKTVCGWSFGFILTLLLALGLAVYVDPHARFGTDAFPSITPSARSIKVAMLGNFDTNPDIVILGSSRAFTLSPMYIEEKTGFSAFNMSVEGGRVGDYAVQLNYMLRSQTKPHLLLVEIAKETLDGDVQNSDLQPLSLLPYMPMKMAFSVADTSLRDILSIQSFSDSFYILALPDVQTRLRTWGFEADGMGFRKPITHEQYVDLLTATVERRLAGMSCRNIDQSAKETLEALLMVAEANGIAVVLYESPTHPALYNAAHRKDPAQVEACQRLLADYFSSLPAAHPNVFFQDLSAYDKVTGLGEDGFYDAVHLRPNAAELVVDALLPQIKSAMEWSLKQTTK
ncbi:MAG: hypothetical protein ACOYZ6_02970 [Chloroflexota bacterium]